MFYTWKLNFVLLLSHFLANIDAANINDILSMLFSQCWSNGNKHMLNQLSFSTRYQRWNNIGSLTLNPRDSFNVVSTLFCQCWKKPTKFQRWNNVGSSTLIRRNSIEVVSTLFCQRWNNVDKCTSVQLSFSTLIQRWCVCWEIFNFPFILKLRSSGSIS